MNPKSYSWLSKWKTREGRKWLWWMFYEKWLRSLPYPNWRSFFLKLGGAKVGENTFVHDVLFQNAYVDGFRHLDLGNNVTLQPGCFVDLADKVIVEDSVTFSPEVMILTHEDCGSKLGKPLSKFYPPKKAPVLLKKGCWLGARSTILCGVTVGECSVVAAGSVVKEDVPAWSVVAGIPAKVVKQIKQESETVDHAKNES